MGRAVSAPFDHGRPVRMELAFISITNQRHQVQRASWSLLLTTKRQLGSRQTTEAQRDLAPRSLVSSESLQPIQTPLNVNSRMERDMWRLHIFWQAAIPDMACGSGHVWNRGASQVPLFKSITDRLVVIQREKQDMLGTKTRRTGQRTNELLPLS